MSQPPSSLEEELSLLSSVPKNDSVDEHTDLLLDLVGGTDFPPIEEEDPATNGEDSCLFDSIVDSVHLLGDYNDPYCKLGVPCKPTEQEVDDVVSTSSSSKDSCGSSSRNHKKQKGDDNFIFELTLEESLKESSIINYHSYVDGEDKVIPKVALAPVGQWKTDDLISVVAMNSTCDFFESLVWSASISCKLFHDCDPRRYDAVQERRLTSTPGRKPPLKTYAYAMYQKQAQAIAHTNLPNFLFVCCVIPDNHKWYQDNPRKRDFIWRPAVTFSKESTRLLSDCDSSTGNTQHKKRLTMFHKCISLYIDTLQDHQPLFLPTEKNWLTRGSGFLQRLMEFLSQLLKEHCGTPSLPTVPVNRRRLTDLMVILNGIHRNKKERDVKKRLFEADSDSENLSHVSDDTECVVHDESDDESADDSDDDSDDDDSDFTINSASTVQSSGKGKRKPLKNTTPNKRPGRAKKPTTKENVKIRVIGETISGIESASFNLRQVLKNTNPPCWEVEPNPDKPCRVLAKNGYNAKNYSETVSDSSFKCSILDFQKTLPKEKLINVVEVYCDNNNNPIQGPPNPLPKNLSDGRTLSIKNHSSIIKGAGMKTPRHGFSYPHYNLMYENKERILRQVFSFVNAPLFSYAFQRPRLNPHGLLFTDEYSQYVSGLPTQFLHGGTKRIHYDESVMAVFANGHVEYDAEQQPLLSLFNYPEDEFNSNKHRHICDGVFAYARRGHYAFDKHFGGWDIPCDIQKVITILKYDPNVQQKIQKSSRESHRGSFLQFDYGCSRSGVQHHATVDQQLDLDVVAAKPCFINLEDDIPAFKEIYSNLGTLLDCCQNFTDEMVSGQDGSFVFDDWHLNRHFNEPFRKLTGGKLHRYISGTIFVLNEKERPYRHVDGPDSLFPDQEYSQIFGGYVNFTEKDGSVVPCKFTNVCYGRSSAMQWIQTNWLYQQFRWKYIKYVVEYNGCIFFENFHYKDDMTSFLSAEDPDGKQFIVPPWVADTTTSEANFYFVYNPNSWWNRTVKNAKLERVQLEWKPYETDAQCVYSKFQEVLVTPEFLSRAPHEMLFEYPMVCFLKKFTINLEDRVGKEWMINGNVTENDHPDKDYIIPCMRQFLSLYYLSLTLGSGMIFAAVVMRWVDGDYLMADGRPFSDPTHESLYHAFQDTCRSWGEYRPWNGREMRYNDPIRNKHGLDVPLENYKEKEKVRWPGLYKKEQFWTEIDHLQEALLNLQCGRGYLTTSGYVTQKHPYPNCKYAGPKAAMKFPKSALVLGLVDSKYAFAVARGAAVNVDKKTSYLTKFQAEFPNHEITAEKLQKMWRDISKFLGDGLPCTMENGSCAMSRRKKKRDIHIKDFTPYRIFGKDLYHKPFNSDHGAYDHIDPHNIKDLGGYVKMNNQDFPLKQVIGYTEYMEDIRKFCEALEKNNNAGGVTESVTTSRVDL